MPAIIAIIGLGRPAVGALIGVDLIGAEIVSIGEADDFLVVVVFYSLITFFSIHRSYLLDIRDAPARP